jgi:hypothetical protein
MCNPGPTTRMCVYLGDECIERMLLRYVDEIHVLGLWCRFCTLYRVMVATWEEGTFGSGWFAVCYGLRSLDACYQWDLFVLP